MKENRVLYAIEQFISLNETEKKLFLEVVSPKQNTPLKKNKSSLPYEFSEEYFYNQLVNSHKAKGKKQTKSKL